MKKIIVTILYLAICATSTFAQVVVIAHKSVPVDEIKKTELLDFYTGDIKLWDDGEPVVVLDLKPKDEAKKVFYNYLGKSTSRMKSIWMKNMLSGEGDPPESLESEEALLKKVASTPGAIGFVSQSKVTNKVKTLVLILQKEQ